MQKFLTLILFVALSGLASQLAGQQPPQDQPSSQQQAPGSQQQQAPAEQPAPQQPPAAEQPGSQSQPPAAEQPGTQPQPTAASPQSAETFRGKIARVGNQLMFQEAKSQTNFQVDDQARVAPYEGKSVQLTATVDAKTASLHVVDISPGK